MFAWGVQQLTCRVVKFVYKCLEGIERLQLQICLVVQIFLKQDGPPLYVVWLHLDQCASIPYNTNIDINTLLYLPMLLPL